LERGAQARDEKVKNLIVNYTMITMSLFEEVFSAAASTMSEALAAGASAMTEALGGGSREGSAEKVSKEVTPKVSKGVAQTFAKMRKEMAEQFFAGSKSFDEFIRDPSFDEGVRIVESHRFKLPNLTEPLSDEDLASYLALLKAQDPEMGRMLQELAEWQKTTPHFSKEESP
jgi:hypothetical protein